MFAGRPQKAQIGNKVLIPCHAALVTKGMNLPVSASNRQQMVANPETGHLFSLDLDVESQSQSWTWKESELELFNRDNIRLRANLAVAAKSPAIQISSVTLIVRLFQSFHDLLKKGISLFMRRRLVVL